MKTRWLTVTITIALSTTALVVLLGLMKEDTALLSTPALAASKSRVAAPSTPTTPTVTAVDPSQTPNDIDTPIVIHGSNFTTTVSGTVLLTMPTAYVGGRALMDVVWVNSTTLSATVPWGLDPGVYSLTVTNPGGGWDDLPDVFTVTQGLNVWTTNGPYGGHISQVRINPHRPETVYAVAQGMGILVSTDGATSWEPMLFNLNPPEQICVDAGDPDVLYAGGGSTWRSTDGGSTWEILTVHPPVPFIGRNYRLVADPSQAGVVYAVASDSSPPGLTGGILRSDNYGATDSWITLTQGISDTDFIRLAVHPTDSDTLLAGTQDGNLFYTLDGGQTWTHLTWQAGDQLLFAPTQPPTLLTGCGWGEEFGGGVCQSRDGGQTWRQIAGISLPTAMAAGTDGERVMTYMGTPGGMVSVGVGNQAVDLVRAAATDEEYSALGAGVYRLTTLLPTDWIYLPSVMTGFLCD